MMNYISSRNTATENTTPMIPNYDAEKVRDLRKYKYTGVFKGEKLDYKILGAYSTEKFLRNGRREDLVLELLITGKGYVKQTMQGVLIQDDGSEVMSDLAVLTNKFCGLMINDNPRAFEPTQIKAKRFDSSIPEIQNWYPNIIGKTGNVVLGTYKDWEFKGRTGFLHKAYFFSSSWLCITEIEKAITTPAIVNETVANAQKQYELFRNKCISSGYDPNEIECNVIENSREQVRQESQSLYGQQNNDNPYGQQAPKDGIPF